LSLLSHRKQVRCNEQRFLGNVAGPALDLNVDFSANRSIAYEIDCRSYAPAGVADERSSVWLLQRTEIWCMNYWISQTAKIVLYRELGRTANVRKPQSVWQVFTDRLFSLTSPRRATCRVGLLGSDSYPWDVVESETTHWSISRSFLTGWPIPILAVHVICASGLRCIL